MSHKRNLVNNPEPENSQATDKCIADVIMKGGSGMLIGSVLTLCFTRPRTYPIWLGIGFGIGLAYDCCQSRWKAVATATNRDT